MTIAYVDDKKIHSSSVVVAVDALLVVDRVHKHVALRGVLELLQALDVLARVVETCREHECLVSVFAAVRKAELVLVWQELRHLRESVSARPGLDLGGHCA